MTTYQEPTGQELAGHLHYSVLPSPYEVFMKEQGIPIYRDIGVYDSRQLPLGPWKRMGGQGSFIQLDGQAGYFGLYVVQVPAGGVLNAEHHMYEELFLVIEGRGSTEVWKEGSAKKQAFEWQPGTHFAVPLNASHRLVNATSSPALLLVATSAPQVMGLFPLRSFVFDSAQDFPDRYDQSDDYFKPRDQLEPNPQDGRALLRTNVIPDIAHCYLPLDNQRLPGYRRVIPKMAGDTFFTGFIAEYPSGRYSKAHYHQPGIILVCLRGKGYTYTWPKELGIHPWETGKGHLVKRQDYIAGGMVSAAPAPGGGDWFHQHFCVSKDLFRVRAIGGGRIVADQAGDQVTGANAEMAEGGHSVAYRDEDAHIQREYKAMLKKEGVEFQMPASSFK